MRYYQIGIGAEATPVKSGALNPTKQSEFQALSDIAANLELEKKPFALVVVEDTGKTRSFAFDDKAQAQGSYDLFKARIPDSTTDAFAAWYDKSEDPQMMDLVFRKPKIIKETQTVKETTKESRVGLGWILGGIGLGIGALILAKK